jgi:hypothetical protein
MSDSQRGFGLAIVFTDHLQILSTSNYNSLTEFQTPTINVATAHIKSSLAVSWQWILTVEILPLLR